MEATYFDEVITDGQNFFDVYDEYFRISLKAKNFRTLSAQHCQNIAKDNDKLTHLLQKCFQLFAKALENRFEQLGYHLPKGSKKWNLIQKLKKDEPIDILIGFKVTKHWAEPITVGPVANEPSAKEFRSFWHGATVLRKFADSRVCECMVWSDYPTPSVGNSILCFLLNKYFNLPEKSLSWKSSFFETTASKKQNNIGQSYFALSTILRSLKDLPLAITNIHPISPFLRDTEPNSEHTYASNIGGKLVEDHYIPTKHAIPRYTPSVEVFIKMAFSTKWGNDVEAVEKLNTAFYLQIAEQLRKYHKLMCVPTEKHLYVVKDNIVFRLIIANDKMHKLLEENVEKLKDSGMPRIESSPEGKALARFRKTFVSELNLASSLHSFSLKNAFFSRTVQLLKLWLGAHQMSTAISDYALEMIAVAAFEQKDEPVAGSIFSAFRKVLKLIINHNWVQQPLLVDFDAAWSEEDIEKLTANFIKMRPVLCPMVIITNEDHVGTKWTKNNPSPLMLKRIISLAENSLKLLNDGIIVSDDVDLFASIMQTNLSPYDAILHLQQKYITRRSKEVEEGDLKGLPVMDFDPVEDFINMLSNYFGTSALFFFNRYGGQTIGVKFNPFEAEVPAKMTEVDVLSDLMSDAKVDPSSLGQHPRFSSYKNVAKAAAQQADRRKEAFERQRDRRFDAQNHTRHLAENIESDEDLDEEVEEEKPTPQNEPRKKRYCDELMTSEWLVDIPDRLSEEWIMIPSPVGRRTLVVANRGVTTVYAKSGQCLNHFKSKLPCRNNKYTLLDCILDKHKFYILDVLAWNGMTYTEYPFDNRRFFIQSGLDEFPSLQIASKSCKYTFHGLPSCHCSKEQMESLLRTEFEFDLDGLLFYHSEVMYTAGQSPLVGWLKPWMLPEILNVDIPEKYLAGNKDKLSSSQFIEKFNKQHKHTSQINKDEEMTQ